MLHEARDWSGTNAESKAVHDRINVLIEEGQKKHWLLETQKNIMADLHAHQSTTLNW